MAGPDGWDESTGGWSSPPPADQADPAAPDAAAQPSRYQAGQLLGQGGMGRVVVAYDPVLGRDVALKRVRVGGRPQAAARLLQEARVGASLEHPGIVPVYDAGTDADGGVWVAMRVIRGQTLAAIVRDAAGPQRLGLVRRLHAVTEAVAYAHNRGVVHGDITPANLMLGQHGEVQVLDWGLARAADSDAAGAPRPDASPAGTPAYMSPEQAGVIDVAVDQRADVWSLGAILFEVLCGERLVLRGPAPTRAPQQRSSADIARRLSQAPPELVAIVRRALATDPSDRYPSAAELAKDLGRFLDGRLVDAHPYSFRDHLLRFVRAWRVPLLVAAVAVAALAMVWVRGVAREDVKHAALLAELAAGRAQDGQRAEAARLAVDALEHAETPVARGVLAMVMAGDGATLAQRISLPANCTRPALSPDATSLSCHDGPRLAVYDFPQLRRRWGAEVGGSAEVSLARDWLVVGQGTARDARPFPIDVRSMDDGRLVQETSYELHRGGRVASAGSVMLRARGGLVLHTGSDQAARTLSWCGASRSTAGAVAGDLTEVVVGCADGRILRGDPGVDTPVRVHALGAEDFASAIAFDGSGGLAVGTWGGRLLRVDAGGTVAPAPLALDDGPIGSIRVQGEVAVVTSDTAIWLWPRGAAMATQLPHSERRVLAFTERGLWTVGGDVATLWRVASRRAAGLVVGDGISALAVGATGAVAAGDGAGCLSGFDEAGGRTVFYCDPGEVMRAVGYLPASRGIVGQRAGRHELVQFASQGHARRADILLGAAARRLGVLSDDTVCGLTFGVAMVCRRPGEAPVVTSLDGVTVDLSVAPNRRWMAALTATGAVWTTEGGAPQQVVAETGATAIGAGAGEWIVLGADQRLVRRDLVGAVTASATFGPALDDVAVDGQGRIATGHRDGSVRVWSADLELLSSMTGHRERAATVAFGPGDTLWTGSWDGTLRRWDLAVLSASHASLRAAVERHWGGWD